MTETLTACPHCSTPLNPGSLFCPSCHRWIFEQRLQQLLHEANQAQEANPMLAASLLREAMALVTPDSQPYQQLEQHAQRLAAAAFGHPQGAASTVPPPLRRGEMLGPQNETWLSALLKTGGSMAVSMYVYQLELGWPFAIGFVLLILIHEMGHVVANWYLGIKQSPPIFIPYVGAVIWLRQNPPDAKAEAVTGIAGPVAGTLGSLVCYAIAIFTGNPLFYLLAGYAMIMNLFNMLPIAPLDGGRVSAAITPWLWPLGLILFITAIWRLDAHQSSAGFNWIGLLVAFWILRSAWPRIRRVLWEGEIKHSYYRVGVTGRLYVIFSYVMLTALLVTMLYETELYRLLRF